MEALWVDPDLNNQVEPKWRTMVTISLVLHLAVFSLIFFVPEHMPTRRIRGTVYEVNLVQLPTRTPARVEGSAKAKAGKPVISSKKTTSTPAKRISRQKKKEKPVVIAKRTVSTQKKEAKKPVVPPSKRIEKALSKIEKKVKSQEDASKRIDQALSKIEKKVKAEDDGHVSRAISELERRGVGTPTKGVAGGGPPVTGIAIEIYKRDVEDWIKSHWAYPVALNKEDLEAIIVVKAKSDGSILKWWFTKKSSNVMFNQSVLKAVEQSDPLPRFPPGYRVTHEEFEITFNLMEMEG
jgi:colicin import membrane protein